MSKKIPNPIDEISPLPDIVDLMFAVSTTTPRGIKGYRTSDGYYKASSKKKQGGYRDSAGYWHSGKKR